MSRYYVRLRGRVETTGLIDFPVTSVNRSESMGPGIWAINAQFPAQEYAVDAAKQWLKDHPDDHVDVLKEDKNLGNIVWCSKENYQGSTITDERTQVQTDLDKPLNIKREDLVARLQENLDAEAKERETVEAKERAARITVQQFVTDHEDEIVQWIGAGAPGGFGSGSWETIATAMTRFFEDNDYKPKSARKSKRENDLEKFVRVLNMATDSTVEVKPNQPIYDLL